MVISYNLDLRVNNYKTKFSALHWAAFALLDPFRVSKINCSKAYLIKALSE
jgi:hypothetical protein